MRAAYTSEPWVGLITTGLVVGQVRRGRTREKPNRPVVFPGELLDSQGCVLVLVVVRIAHALLNRSAQVLVIPRDSRGLLYLYMMVVSSLPLSGTS